MSTNHRPMVLQTENHHITVCPAVHEMPSQRDRLQWTMNQQNHEIPFLQNSYVEAGAVPRRLQFPLEYLVVYIFSSIFIPSLHQIQILEKRLINAIKISSRDSIMKKLHYQIINLPRRNTLFTFMGNAIIPEYEDVFEFWHLTRFYIYEKIIMKQRILLNKTQLTRR